MIKGLAILDFFFLQKGTHANMIYSIGEDSTELLPIYFQDFHEVTKSSQTLVVILLLIISCFQREFS